MLHDACHAIVMCYVLLDPSGGDIVKVIKRYKRFMYSTGH